jgi:hypothetical protein
MKDAMFVCISPYWAASLAQALKDKCFDCQSNNNFVFVLNIDESVAKALQNVYSRSYNIFQTVVRDH